MAIEFRRSFFVACHNDTATLTVNALRDYLGMPYIVGGDWDESGYWQERSWNLMQHQRSDVCHL